MGTFVKDMTDKQAQAEAEKRWGSRGAIRYRPAVVARPNGRPGRLARYAYTVGNGGLGKSCSIQGQGDTWRAAFADVRPIS